MSEDFNEKKEEIVFEMDTIIEKMKAELSKIRTGKANPQTFQDIKVECYGSVMPLSQLATINTTDAKTVIIKPFDKGTLADIITGIVNVNLGFNPLDEGEIIRINIPPLTEERRKELAKKVKSIGEDFKISIRNIRKSGNDFLKKLKNDGTSDDFIKGYEKEIQDLTDKNTAEIDSIIQGKSAELMHI